MKKIMLFIIVLFILSISRNSCALRNPAAVYCDALGYESFTKKSPKGDLAMCRLPDGTIVDAWKFLSGEEAQEYSYCAKQGYEIKTINHTAYCILPDGSEVDVITLMGLNFEETRCGDGTCGIPENYSTCPEDCPSGGWDGYCDKVKDGIIDPDCKEGEDPDEQPAITGDLDGDGDVDRDDLNILLADRNKTVNDSACGEACDLDGDGVITVLDARKLVLLCTRPRCATE